MPTFTYLILKGFIYKTIKNPASFAESRIFTLQILQQFMEISMHCGSVHFDTQK